jgi:hypothetical protein
MSAPEVKIKRFSRSKKPLPEEGEGEAPPPLVEELSQVEEEKVREMVQMAEPEPVIDIEDPDDGFLDDLKIGEMPPIEDVPPPPPLKRSGAPAKGGGRKKKTQDIGGNDFMQEYGEFFSEKATPILGADKRVLLSKVRQYKALFHDIPEIRSFRIKPNATDTELENAIAEMDVIVSVGTVQELTDQMILSAIRVVETVSSRTERYDVSGTADMLAVNHEFKKIAKLLALKYKVYSQVPPEWQMMLIVFSTAMVARQTNIRKKEIDGMLSQPM